MYNQLNIPRPSSRVRGALDSSSALRCKITNADEAAEILIYDDIGDPDSSSTPEAVAAFLAANRRKPVTVRINSYGGLAYDGLVMANSLRSHDALVTTIAEGIAASAASIILASGGRVRAYGNASIMCHCAQAIALGNSDLFREMADWMDKLDAAIAMSYAAKTGRSQAQMMALMRGDGKRDGTWFTAAEAKAIGLVDDVIPITGGRGSDNRVAPDPDAAIRQLRARQRIRQIEREAGLTRAGI